jgi:hypothetical protein
MLSFFIIYFNIRIEVLRLEIPCHLEKYITRMKGKYSYRPCIDINMYSYFVNSVGPEEDPELGLVYHFLSYLPKDGYLWELDSLKLNPTKLRPISDDENWIHALQPFLIDKINSNGLRAHVLVVAKEIIAYQSELEAKVSHLMSNPDVSHPSDRLANVAKLIQENLRVQAEIKTLENNIREKKKNDSQVIESNRYSLPFITNMAAATARAGMDLREFQHALGEVEQASTDMAPQGRDRRGRHSLKQESL